MGAAGGGWAGGAAGLAGAAAAAAATFALAAAAAFDAGSLLLLPMDARLMLLRLVVRLKFSLPGGWAGAAEGT